MGLIHTQKEKVQLQVEIALMPKVNILLPEELDLTLGGGEVAANPYYHWVRDHSPTLVLMKQLLPVFPQVLTKTIVQF